MREELQACTSFLVSRDLLVRLKKDAKIRIDQPRVRELWWRGVAPRSRADVWERAIGNELALTVATYSKALQRSQDIEVQIAKGGKHEQCKERTWFNAIQRDIRATLPELKLFQRGNPLHDDLTKVLKAYCMYRSDVGYCHGTHVSPYIPASSCALRGTCDCSLVGD